MMHHQGFGCETLSCASCIVKRDDHLCVTLLSGVRQMQVATDKLQHSAKNIAGLKLHVLEEYRFMGYRKSKGFFTKC